MEKEEKTMKKKAKEVLAGVGLKWSSETSAMAGIGYAILALVEALETFSEKIDKIEEKGGKK